MTYICICIRILYVCGPESVKGESRNKQIIGSAPKIIHKERKRNKRRSKEKSFNSVNKTIIESEKGNVNICEGRKACNRNVCDDNCSFVWFVQG